jgi:hypothetical protein
MELAHLLGSDRRIHCRDFDPRSHGSGGPFVVIVFPASTSNRARSFSFCLAWARAAPADWMMPP